MRQSKTKLMRSPAVTVDSKGPGQVEQASGWESSVPTASPLDAIARAGAREMLQKALESGTQKGVRNLYVKRFLTPFVLPRMNARSGDGREIPKARTANGLR